MYWQIAVDQFPNKTAYFRDNQGIWRFNPEITIDRLLTYRHVVVFAKASIQKLANDEVHYLPSYEVKRVTAWAIDNIVARAIVELDRIVSKSSDCFVPHTDFSFIRKQARIWCNSPDDSSPDLMFQSESGVPLPYNLCLQAEILQTIACFSGLDVVPDNKCLQEEIVQISTGLSNRIRIFPNKQCFRNTVDTDNSAINMVGDNSSIWRSIYLSKLDGAIQARAAVWFLELQDQSFVLDIGVIHLVLSFLPNHRQYEAKQTIRRLRYLAACFFECYMPFNRTNYSKRRRNVETKTLN